MPKPWEAQTFLSSPDFSLNSVSMKNPKPEKICNKL